MLDSPRGVVRPLLFSPLPLAICFFTLGCGSGASGSPTLSDTDGGDAGGACLAADGTLAGATYDVSASRFAFGGKPVETNERGLVKWTGPDGALAIEPNGSVGAVLDAGAPETYLPPLHLPLPQLQAYVTQYFEAVGVPTCQIASTADATSSSGGAGPGSGGPVSGPSTIRLQRVWGDVPVSNSLAWATFDSRYQTTAEGFYWPEIPADVIASAKAFRQALSTPAGLAQYQAKLPEYAQEKGVVTIHHTPAAPVNPASTFQVVVTYDVPPVLLEGGAQLPSSFDRDGKPVTLPE